MLEMLYKGGDGNSYVLNVPHGATTWCQLPSWDDGGGATDPSSMIHTSGCSELPSTGVCATRVIQSLIYIMSAKKRCLSWTARAVQTRLPGAYGIDDMRHYLHSLSEIATLSLLLDDMLIDLAGCDVVVARKANTEISTRYELVSCRRGMDSLTSRSCRDRGPPIRSGH